MDGVVICLVEVYKIKDPGKERFLPRSYLVGLENETRLCKTEFTQLPAQSATLHAASRCFREVLPQLRPRTNPRKYGTCALILVPNGMTREEDSNRGYRHGKRCDSV